MVLNNLLIVGDATPKCINIKGKFINEISINPIATSSSLHFNKVIAFPGLINSHDHLDFNLFPQLGNRIYNNYTEWGDDIHKTDKVKINTVLSIPKKLRVEYGIYKNLLNGITTVVNHGNTLAITNSLIHVFQNCFIKCFPI